MLRGASKPDDGFRATLLLPAMSRSDFQSRRVQFRKLHEKGCFVIPNPWDVGTARYLRQLGFPALATTSAGFAFSRGLPDTAVGRDAMLQHIAEIVAAVDLPVNADFESGYARQPEEVAANVRLCLETGVAGLSIEDATRDPGHPLYDLPFAVERIRAARTAIDESRTGVLLTARAECYLVGVSDPLRESIRRLEAYADAGAGVLYAPGPSDHEDIKAIVGALSPKPVNILMSAHSGLAVSDLADLGVRRVSVGSALARAAWTGFIRAARAIAHEGLFTGFEGSISFAEINGFFQTSISGRPGSGQSTWKNFPRGKSTRS
jgi:2-methylisocitrate lyase-like PEP mutase family enzyme